MSNKLHNHTISTPPITPEMVFIINCCQPIPDLQKINSQMDILVSEKFRSQKILSMAFQHAVIPLLYQALKDLPPYTNEYNTDTFLSQVKNNYLQIVQRNMLMSAQLLKIIDFLERNHISALAFKGPALAQLAYGDLTLRQYGDLDILIQKKDRKKMFTLLLAEEYIPEIQLDKVSEEIFFDQVNVIGMYHPHNHIRIEIHWELLSRNYAIEWEEHSLWEKTGEIYINGKSLPTLTIEKQLLYLCIHGSKHLFERAEWICDIDRTLRSQTQIDWSLLQEEAKTLGIERMFYLGLALSSYFFKTPLPPTIYDTLQSDDTIQTLMNIIISDRFTKETETKKSYNSFLLLLKMRERKRDKLRFIWRALFVTKLDDFLFIQLPPKLSFLYPFVRFYRLIKKYSS